MGPEPPPYRYMAIYDIETDDLKATMEALGKAAAGGEMVISSAMDMEHVTNWIFTPHVEGGNLCIVSALCR